MDLSSIDVNEIMIIKLLTNNDNDEHLDKLKFSTKIIKWEETQMLLKFDFEDP